MTPRTPEVREATGSGLSGRDVATSDPPLNRFAAAVRRLSAVAVGRPLSDDELAEAADQLAAIATRLESAAGPARRALERMPDPDGHPQDFFPTSPVIGLASPIAPPVEVWSVSGEGGSARSGVGPPSATPTRDHRRACTVA